MLLADKRHTSREFRGAILARAKYSAIGLDSPGGNGLSHVKFRVVLRIVTLDVGQRQ